MVDQIQPLGVSSQPARGATASSGSSPLLLRISFFYLCIGVYILYIYGGVALHEGFTSLHQVTQVCPNIYGAFPVSKIINPVSVRLRIPRSLWIHPNFHISKIKLVKAISLIQPPPTPRIIDGSPVYMVKKLLVGLCRSQGSSINWEGYSPEERSWVAARNIMYPELIKDFH